MFRRHRSDPDPTTVANLRDRLDAITKASPETVARDDRPVRGRLAASGSLGLRNRLAQPVLSTPRG